MDIFVHHSNLEKTKNLLTSSSSYGLVLMGFNHINYDLILNIINELKSIRLKIISITGIDSEIIHDNIDDYFALNNESSIVTTWHDLKNNDNYIESVDLLLSTFDLEIVIFVYQSEKPYLNATSQSEF